MSNKKYREILSTTPQMQIVAMCLKRGEDIPEETHKNITQFIRVESGTATIIIGDKTHKVIEGDIVMVPPNIKHHVKNTGDELKLITVYSPPAH